MFGPFLPRVAVYVDGFNFFHALDDFGENHLKWLDLWALSLRLVGQQADLKRVLWCSAKHPHREKAARWTSYRDALIARGVTLAEGNFTRYEPIEEKEGDVHLALHLMLDAVDDVFDIAYLVTADSDQAATARLFKERFGSGPSPKKIISVAPPNRTHSRNILEQAPETPKVINKADIEECLLPERLRGPTGRMIQRPMRYAPPSGWLPDRQRKLALLAAATSGVVEPTVS
jgi:hypothetical protein